MEKARVESEQAREGWFVARGYVAFLDEGGG